MKKFLTTTAVALVIGSGAYAESHSAMGAMTSYEASELIGMRLYAGDSEGANTDWQDIGEINDLVVTLDGNVSTAVVGVGGFLGIGEKEVALGLDTIKQVTGENGEVFLVVGTTQEALEGMPDYVPADEMAMMDDENMEADAMAETEVVADADATAETEVAEDQDLAGTAMLTPPMIEREGYLVAERADLTTEDLTGARIYGANDEDVGEVSELLIGDDGQITKAVLDIGGFLGMGEHHIAVSLDELTILRADGGDDLRVYIDSTQEALEALPEYEG